MRSLSTQLDTTCELVTPENVKFEYRLAGPMLRSFAYAIDFLVKALILVLLAVALKPFGEIGGGLFLVIMFVIEWLYFVAFETFTNGQSIGKRACSLRVINVNGTPLSSQQSIIRNLLRPADQFPALYATGVMLMVFTRRYQRLGDLAANTMVVIEQRITSPSLSAVDIKATEAVHALLPRRIALDSSLKKTVQLYAEKRNKLPRALLVELVQPAVELLEAQLELPKGIDIDALMCALYRHIYIGDRNISIPELNTAHA